MGEGENAEKVNFEWLEGSEVSESLMALFWGAPSNEKGLAQEGRGEMVF